MARWLRAVTAIGGGLYILTFLTLTIVLVVTNSNTIADILIWMVFGPIAVMIIVLLVELGIIVALWVKNG